MPLIGTSVASAMWPRFHSSGCRTSITRAPDSIMRFASSVPIVAYGTSFSSSLGINFSLLFSSPGISSGLAGLVGMTGIVLFQPEPAIGCGLQHIFIAGKCHCQQTLILHITKVIGNQEETG